MGLFGEKGKLTNQAEEELNSDLQSSPDCSSCFSSAPYSLFSTSSQRGPLTAHIDQSFFCSEPSSGSHHTQSESQCSHDEPRVPKGSVCRHSPSPLKLHLLLLSCFLTLLQPQASLILLGHNQVHPPLSLLLAFLFLEQVLQIPKRLTPSPLALKPWTE